MISCVVGNLVDPILVLEFEMIVSYAREVVAAVIRRSRQDGSGLGLFLTACRLVKVGTQSLSGERQPQHNRFDVGNWKEISICKGLDQPSEWAL